MLELYLSEWRRLQRPALIATAVHLLLLAALVQFETNSFELRSKEQLAFFGLYLLASAAFAFRQLFSYAAVGRWHWLIHRPLPPSAVFGALALAAAAHIATIIGLPTLLTALYFDWFTTDTIDLHHYLMVLFLLEACLITWLVAIMTMYGRLPYLLALLLASVLLLRPASGVLTVLLGAAMIALLLVVAIGNFKADRHGAPSGMRATVLTAATILPGFYILLLVIGMLWFEGGLRYMGELPGQGKRPPGGLYEASRIDQRSNILAGLSMSADPRKPEWAQRLRQATTATILPEIGRFAVRYQLSNAMTPTPRERYDGTKMAFDQDKMRFVLTDGESGKELGQFGLHGDTDRTPFPAIPVDSMHFQLAPHVVYSYGPDLYRNIVRAVVPESEQIVAAPVKARNNYFLLTTRRVVVYLPDPDVPSAIWKEVASVPLPSPINDLSIVDIAMLDDLALLSFTGGRHMKMGGAAGQQTVVTLDAAGNSQIIASRTLAHDYPVWYEHLNWIVSPAMYSAIEVVGHIHAIGNTPNVLRHDGLAQQRPLKVWLAALLLMLASAATAWWALRYKAWRGWALACFVIGLPALAVLLAVMPRMYAARPKAAVLATA
jgi:hypothetical protein